MPACTFSRLPVAALCASLYALAPASAENLAPTAPATSRAPNVIVILADDQGFGDLGLHGNTDLRTPRLDQFAAQSRRFTHFYASPVCAASRAALLTGRSAPDTGVWGVHLARDYMRTDETTLAQVYQNAGYATGFIGKWHNGKHEPWLPWNRGFQDSWMATLYVHENNVVSHNGDAVQWRGWTSDRIGDQAIRFIESRRAEPFFLYIAFLAPHEPWHAPAERIARYQARGLSPALSTVYAMIEQMDENADRILDAVERLGLAENTVIVYLSDNGPIGESSNLGNLSSADMALRNPAGLRGAKGNLSENGIRVPGFIRWSGRIPPGDETGPANMSDVFPTLLALTGTGLPPALATRLDGQSLAPLLLDPTTTMPPREKVLPYWEARWATYHTGVLREPEKLDFTQQNFAVRTPHWKWLQAWGRAALFDIQADPQERHDLSAPDADTAARLQGVAHEWFVRRQAEAVAYRQPRFPIGPVTRPLAEVAEIRNVGHLPGFSAVRTEGNVVVKTHHSEKWIAAGDSQTLLAHVRLGGRYQIRLEADGIAEAEVIAVQVGAKSLQATLGRASGAGATIGELVLPAGDTEVTLTAVSLPEDAPAFMQKFEGLRFTYLSE